MAAETDEAVAREPAAAAELAGRIAAADTTLRGNDVDERRRQRLDSGLRVVAAT